MGIESLPALTTAQMREVDRRATAEFMINVGQMMELAAAGVRATVQAELGSTNGRRIRVLAGPGHNGASGLVAARQLANAGGLVDVLLTRPIWQLDTEARHHVATLMSMGIDICVVPWDIEAAELDAALRESDLIVDALLGYSATGASHGTVADIIKRANDCGRPLLSVDLPSGMDPDSGLAAGEAINASATAVIALPKTGLVSDAGRSRAGSLYLVDIGLPAALYRSLGMEFEQPFGNGPLLRLS